MKKEKSAGAIIFHMEEGNPMYLLLHYPSVGKPREYWDLPKGHIEGEESEQETAKREVQEETGLAEIELFDRFCERIHYWFESEGQKVSKTVVFFLGQAHTKKVAISAEHIGFLWLPYEEAMGKLTYKNARQVLEKAHEFLRARKVVS